MTDRIGLTPVSTWWTVRCFCHSTLNLICLLFHPTPITKAQRSPSLSLCKARTWKKSDDSFKSRADKWTYMYFKIEITRTIYIKCHYRITQRWYQMSSQDHTVVISIDTAVSHNQDIECLTVLQNNNVKCNYRCPVMMY